MLFLEYIYCSIFLLNISFINGLNLGHFKMKNTKFFNYIHFFLVKIISFLFSWKTDKLPFSTLNSIKISWELDNQTWQRLAMIDVHYLEKIEFWIVVFLKSVWLNNKEKF